MEHIWTIVMLEMCKHTFYAYLSRIWKMMQFTGFIRKVFATKILLSGKFSPFLTLISSRSGWLLELLTDLIMKRMDSNNSFFVRNADCANFKNRKTQHSFLTLCRYKRFTNHEWCTLFRQVIIPGKRPVHAQWHSSHCSYSIVQWRASPLAQTHQKHHKHGLCVFASYVCVIWIYCRHILLHVFVKVVTFICRRSYMYLSR